MSICFPVGLSIKMASPCPTSRNDTVRVFSEERTKKRTGAMRRGKTSATPILDDILALKYNILYYTTLT
jgi:hypothetical protein